MWLAVRTVDDRGPGEGPVTVHPPLTRSASCSWAANALRPPMAAVAAASRLMLTATTPPPPGPASTEIWVLTWHALKATTSVAKSARRNGRGG